MTDLVTVLVGPPCVGKSTYLKELDYDFVISSDDVVEILTNRAGIDYHEYFKYPANSSIKRKHSKIFEQLVKESKSFEHVVWDLTNLTKKARNRIFKHYPKATFKAVVFDFQGSESLILKRNQQRFKQQGKYVNEMVIKDMFLSYEPVDKTEVFSELKVLNINENTVVST
jgi:predicted kinase